MDQADKCYGTGFYANIGGCYNIAACTRENQSIGLADEVGCKACLNRCFNPVKNTCNLFGTDKPYLRNADGTCSCNTAIGAFEAGGDCRVCGTNAFFNTYAGSCRSCLGADNFAVNEERHKCLGTSE